MEKFNNGDVIGCGINFIKKELFFTHNGNYKGAAFRLTEIAIDQFYPTFGLHSTNECITANFG